MFGVLSNFLAKQILIVTKALSGSGYFTRNFKEYNTIHILPKMRCRDRKTGQTELQIICQENQFTGVSTVYLAVFLHFGHPNKMAWFTGLFCFYFLKWKELFLVLEHVYDYQNHRELLNSHGLKFCLQQPVFLFYVILRTKTTKS